MGYNDQEFSEYPKNQLYHPEFKNKIKDFVGKVRAKDYKGHSSIDLRLKHKTKGYRWYRLESKAFERNTNLEMVKSIEIISDINKIKETESKLIAQQKVIKKVTSLMPEFSYIVDLSSDKYIFNNNKSLKLLGYKPEEFFKIEINEILHKSFIESRNEFYKKIHSSKSIKNFEIELQLKHKTKGYRWFKHRVTIFERNDANLPNKLLKSLEDIHEQKVNRIRKYLLIFICLTLKKELIFSLILLKEKY